MKMPALTVAALCCLASPVFAALTVTTADPEKFTDAADRDSDPRKIAQALESHLTALGNKYAPQGTLAIEIVDVDRAGRPRMNVRTEARVVNGKGDLPCIVLRFTLNGSAPTRERVCDPEFLRPLGSRADERDPLVYEKRMLDEWFRQRFGNKPD
jgi:hypothetical protein